MKIIAEFCQNHNGSYDILSQMIAEAAEGGATHAKLQTIFADDLSFRPEFEEGLIDTGGQLKVIKRPYQSEYDRLKKLELTYEQHRRFVNDCRSAGLEPLTTAFNLTCIPEIRGLGWKSIKVASYDCGSTQLVEALADNFEELIVSTGASYDEEIEATVALLKRKGTNFTLLHCVTIYPTPLVDMNLSRLSYLRSLAPSVGLSDHSMVARDGVKADLVAIHLGAQAIERHFTVLPEDQTRDGKVSITKAHLREMVNFAAMDHCAQEVYLAEHVPEREIMMGQEKRPLSDAELLNRAYYRGRFCNKRGERQIFNWEPEAAQLINKGDEYV
jgi:N,N'-diacetyllegionaminate synthase